MRAKSPRESRFPESETERPVTVDLTCEQENVSPYPMGDLKSRLSVPISTSSNASARAQLKAMAMSALQDNVQNQESRLKNEEHKNDESYIPPRLPDPKLGVYEQNEARRKFSTFQPVCAPCGSEHSQQYVHMQQHLMQQARHAAALHAHAHSLGPSPFPIYLEYPYPRGEYPIPSHLVAHQLRMRDIASHGVNGETIGAQHNPAVSSQHSHSYHAGIQGPIGSASSYRTLEDLIIYPHTRLPSHSSQYSHSSLHPNMLSISHVNTQRSQALQVSHSRPHSADIPEQELAHPFFVQGYSSKVIAREASPDISLRRPGSSCAPSETSKYPQMHSPPENIQSLQTEHSKTKSPTVVHMKNHSPKSLSLDEIRGRAAVIPELVKREKGVPSSLPEKIVLQTKQESRLIVDVDPAPAKLGGTERTKTTDAFTTLVEVAAAAEKVPSTATTEKLVEDNPTTSNTDVIVAAQNELSENRVMHSSPTRLCATRSPVSTSPSSLSSPRYGISTGLVPKPPPLMPITGIQPPDSSSSCCQIALSTKETTVTNVVSSVQTSMTSPEVTTQTSVNSKSKVGSPSVTEPPPLLSREGLADMSSSHNQQVPRQITSPVGPPPLISCNPVPSARTENNSDTVELSKQVYLPRPSAYPDSSYDQSELSVNASRSPQVASGVYNSRSSDVPRSVVRNIFETVTYLGPSTNTYYPAPDVRSQEQSTPPSSSSFLPQTPLVQHLDPIPVEEQNRQSKQVQSSGPTQQVDATRIGKSPITLKDEIDGTKSSLNKDDGLSAFETLSPDDGYVHEKQVSGDKTVVSPITRSQPKSSQEKERKQPSPFSEHIPSSEVVKLSEHLLQETHLFPRGAAVPVIFRDVHEEYPDCHKGSHTNRSTDIDLERSVMDENSGEDDLEMCPPRNSSHAVSNKVIPDPNVSSNNAGLNKGLKNFPVRDASNQAAVVTSSCKSDVSLQVTTSSSPVCESGFDTETMYSNIPKPNVILSIGEHDLSDSDTLSAEEMENNSESADEISSTAVIQDSSEHTSRTISSEKEEDHQDKIYTLKSDNSDITQPGEFDEDISKNTISERESSDVDDISSNSDDVSCSVAVVGRICFSSSSRRGDQASTDYHLHSPEKNIGLSNVSGSIYVDSTDSNLQQDVVTHSEDKQIVLDFDEQRNIPKEKDNTLEQESESQVIDSSSSTFCPAVTSEAMSNYATNSSGSQETFIISSGIEQCGSDIKVESSDDPQTSSLRFCSEDGLTTDEHLQSDSSKTNHNLAPDSSESGNAENNLSEDSSVQSISAIASSGYKKDKRLEEENAFISCSDSEISSTPAHISSEATPSDQVVVAGEDNKDNVTRIAFTCDIIGKADSSNDSKVPFSSLPNMSSSDEEDEEYEDQISRSSVEVPQPDSLEENEYGNVRSQYVKTCFDEHYPPTPSESSSSTKNPLEAQEVIQNEVEPSISSSRKDNICKAFDNDEGNSHSDGNIDDDVYQVDAIDRSVDGDSHIDGVIDDLGGSGDRDADGNCSGDGSVDGDTDDFGVVDRSGDADADGNGSRDGSVNVDADVTGDGDYDQLGDYGRIEGGICEEDIVTPEVPKARGNDVEREEGELKDSETEDDNVGTVGNLSKALDSVSHDVAIDVSLLDGQKTLCTDHISVSECNRSSSSSKPTSPLSYQSQSSPAQMSLPSHTQPSSPGSSQHMLSPLSSPQIPSPSPSSPPLTYPTPPNMASAPLPPSSFVVSAPLPSSPHMVSAPSPKTPHEESAPSP